MTALVHPRRGSRPVALAALLILSLLAGPTRAADLDQAVAAYRAGDHAAASQAFAELAAAEGDPDRAAVLHANAGTAAARAERFGQAVWHLEAALRLAPRDEPARRNLDQVRVRLGQSTRAAASFAETVQRLPVQLSLREARLGLALLATLGLVLAALARLGLAPAATGRLALLTLALAGLWWLADGWSRDRDRQRAVVLEPVVVRAEPAADGKELFRLEPGTVVRSEELRGAWRLVETDSGGRGWTGAGLVREAGG